MNTIRTVQGHDYCFIGQLIYESRCGAPQEWGDIFSGIGVRLYQDTQTLEHFLCVEAAETDDEQWYRVDGAKLVPLAEAYG